MSDMDGVYLSCHGVVSSIEATVAIVDKEILYFDSKKVDDDDIDALTMLFCARIFIESKLGLCLEMISTLLYQLKSVNDKDSDEIRNDILLMQEKTKSMISLNKEAREKLKEKLNNSQTVKRIIH